MGGANINPTSLL